MNVISRRGLLQLLEGKPKDVVKEVTVWFRIAQSAEWSELISVRDYFKDADLIKGKLVFNIRHNRFRLIVLPVFEAKKLYLKALLTHQEYDQGGWKTKWP